MRCARLDEILGLPASERLALSAAIWDSLAEDPGSVPAPEWQLELLAERLDEDERDTAPELARPAPPDRARGVNRPLMRKFPYSIFFRVKGGEVRILGVIHQGRHPKHWMRRLQQRLRGFGRQGRASARFNLFKGWPVAMGRLRKSRGESSVPALPPNSGSFLEVVKDFPRKCANEYIVGYNISLPVVVIYSICNRLARRHFAHIRNLRWAIP
jgi:putative addiction module component (TIGR02574 family)